MKRLQYWTSVCLIFALWIGAAVLADTYTFPGGSGGGGGAVSSVSALNGSVTVSPTTGVVKVSLPGSSASPAASQYFGTNASSVYGFYNLPAGTGTVTSVGLSLPVSVFTVSGSPVTTTGTLTGAFASQTANTVFAAPNGSAGTPSFRALVGADVPLFTSALQGTVPGSGGGTTNFLRADGSWAAPGGSGSPGGTSNNVQYNNAGSFGGATLVNIVSNALELGTSGSAQGTAKFYGATSGSCTVGAQATAGTTTFNLPTSNGTTGQFLQTDGSGNTSWQSATGSGTVNSGTAGQMTYYASTGTAVSGNANATISSGALTLGQSGTAGSVVLNGATSGTVTVGVPAIAGTTTFTLPSSNGTSGQYLQTNGSGVTSWQTVSGGSGGFTAHNISTNTTGVAQNAYFASATLTFTLPTAVGVGGQEIEYVLTGSGTTTTFNTTSSQTISGQASGAITATAQYNAYRFMSDGANWFLE